jgi:c-di-GMP-binding flagellar brake protein YcgR
MDSKLEVKRNNRRRSQRRKPRNSVRVECRKGAHGLGANIVAAVLDISDTGVRLIATQATDPNGEVEIVISGYGMKELIKRIGNVRWQVKLENGHFCTGVEFQKQIAYRDWQNLAAPN